MKKIVAIVSLLLVNIKLVQASVIFSQDFSGSTSVPDYVSSTPNSGQWNNITASGSGSVSIANGTLQFVRSGGNDSFSRTTDFSPTPTAISYVFTLGVNGSAAQTTAATFEVGSGFGVGNSAEANANVYARFGVNLGSSSGTFAVRNIDASANSSSFSGVQTITWILNNSGNSLTYQDPSGNSSSVANDTYDLWVGTTLAFNDATVTTASQSIDDLKFIFSAGAGTINLDNFSITDLSPVPEPATWGAISGIGLLGLCGFRTWRQHRSSKIALV